MDQQYVSRTVPQQTDETLLDAIGNQHSTETALADLVDNSIEHGASEITIQFITSKKYLARIRVQDDGQGMSPEILEEAMNMRKKSYTEDSLSYFGIGMKMAAVSQAAILRVFSRNESRQISGAQLRRPDAGGANFTEILTDTFAQAQYEAFSREKPGSGTVVELSKLDDVSVSKKDSDRAKWLNALTLRISQHFGLVFHRFLENGSVKIFLEQWVEENEEVGGRIAVYPINPFGFVSPRAGYPANFATRTARRTRLELSCHLVPPNSESDNVKIHGKPLENWGGFYVYRNNRLLQAGGWQELVPSQKDLQLARIKLELTPDLLEDGFRLSAEKVGVKFNDEVRKLIPLAKSRQLEKTVEEFLAEAVEIRKTANKRSQVRQPMTPIIGDENLKIADAIRDLIGFKPHTDPLEIVSLPLNLDQVFELEVERKLLRINSDLFEEGGPLDSEPAYEFFKATLYFLLEGHFTRSKINAATQAKIEQMHRILAVSLGIQELHQELEPSLVIPTPIVLAGTSMPSPPTPKPQKAAAEAPEEIFRPVWSTSTKPSIQREQTLATSETASEKRNQGPSQPTDPAERGSLPLQMNDPDVASMCLQALKDYKRTTDVTSVAESLDRTTDETIALLVPTLIGFSGNLNNTEEAYLADEPFNASEREKVVSRFKDGADLSRLSQETGRTIMQVARVLLDSPKTQLRPSSEVLKQLRDSAR